MEIDRRPLRDQIRRYLIERLIRGDLAPGKPVNEKQLTEELGVSRTPLREALIQLEFEGMLVSEPGRGFTVRPLSVRELRDLLETGIELETLALRSAFPFPVERIEKLRSLDEQRRDALAKGDGDEDLLVELDDRWHRALVRGCSNETLHELLRIVRNRLYRYVYLIETSSEQVKKALQEHDQIVDSLDNGDPENAAALLRQHWKRTGEVMEAFADRQ